MATACKICGGAESEHVNSIHAFTTRDGDLRTPEPRKEPQRVQKLAINGGTIEVARLVELMLEKGLLDIPEVLYLAGVGPKPKPKSGFLDPAQQVLPIFSGGNS